MKSIHECRFRRAVSLNAVSTQSRVAAARWLAAGVAQTVADSDSDLVAGIGAGEGQRH
jgi:hypothetical protein